MYPPSCFNSENPACPCHGLSALTVPASLHHHMTHDPHSWATSLHHHLSDDVMDNPHSWPLCWNGETYLGKPTKRKYSAPELPKDPRLWTREDVASWLRHLSSQHRLPVVPLDRFLMNGKALCLMTMEMFVQRVPLGGKLLYKDFRLRLSSALYS